MPFEGEFWAAADALVPHDGGGEAQFWVIAARALFVEFCLKLVAEGRATNDALARELMTADLSRVHAMMRGTIADPLTAPEAARMAESIRAVFNVNAKALKLLPTAGPRFSVANGSRTGPMAPEAGSILFISALCRHERLRAAAHALARHSNEHADDDAPHPRSQVLVLRR
jgi:hypothetical protein